MSAKRTRSSFKIENNDTFDDTSSKITKTIHQPHNNNANNNNKNLSDYEAERLNNIKRNEEYLASLGISQIKSSLLDISIANKQPMKRKVPIKHKSHEIQQPLRRSGRVTIEKLQEEIKLLDNSMDKNDKEILILRQNELDEMIKKKKESTYIIDDLNTNEYVNERYQRLSSEPILLTNMLYNEDEYNKDNISLDIKELVNDMISFSKDKLRTEDDIVTKKIKKNEVLIKKDHDYKSYESITMNEYITNMEKLSLNDKDIAKLTESRITSVYIHPSITKTIVFAGDKLGNLSLWDVDKSNISELDGIYKYKPHISNIAKIHSSKHHPAIIYSTSYDCTIRRFDMNHEAFMNAFTSPDFDELYYTDACFDHEHEDCLYIATSNGCIGFIDLKASNSSYQWKHNAYSGYKLNSIQQHPTMSNILISSEKHDIHIYDVRKSTSNKLKTISSLPYHSKSINAAYTSLDGEYLVSVSQDDTIQIYYNYLNDYIMSTPTKPTSPSKISSLEHYSIPHNNQTGRWLSTFRPTFDPKCPQVFILGSMNKIPSRVLDIYGPSHNNIHKDMNKTIKKSNKSIDLKEEYKSKSIDMIYNLSNEYLGSICSRNAFHDTKYIIACGNSSGRIHVFR